jgi:hypothetical protein
MNMKITKRKIISIIFLTAIGCVFSFSIVTAEDEPITQQQIQLIKNNCISAKNTLTQLHSSDALLRVNMGQSYESMSTKLMTRFNNRLANNNIANINLVDAADNFDSILDAFRLDYIAYEEQLSIAMNIDCQKQPVSFYDAVSSARSKRELVHSDINRLNQSLTQYKSELELFEAEYEAAAAEVKK